MRVEMYSLRLALLVIDERWKFVYPEVAVSQDTGDILFDNYQNELGIFGNNRQLCVCQPLHRCDAGGPTCYWNPHPFSSNDVRWAMLYTYLPNCFVNDLAHSWNAYSKWNGGILHMREISKKPQSICLCLHK